MRLEVLAGEGESMNLQHLTALSHFYLTGPDGSSDSLSDAELLVLMPPCVSFVRVSGCVRLAGLSSAQQVRVTPNSPMHLRVLQDICDLHGPWSLTVRMPEMDQAMTQAQAAAAQAAIAAVGRSHQLTGLSLLKGDFVEDSSGWCDAFPALPRLQALMLSDMLSGDFLAPGELLKFTALTSLRSLDVLVGGADDFTAVCLLNSLTGLEAFRLDCSHVCSMALLGCVPRPTALTRLVLLNARQLSMQDHHVQQLLSMTQLKVLYVPFHECSPSSIDSLRSALPMLQINSA